MLSRKQKQLIYQTVGLSNNFLPYKNDLTVRPDHEDFSALQDLVKCGVMSSVWDPLILEEVYTFKVTDYGRSLLNESIEPTQKSQRVRNHKKHLSRILKSSMELIKDYKEFGELRSSETKEISLREATFAVAEDLRQWVILAAAAEFGISQLEELESHSGVEDASQEDV